MKPPSNLNIRRSIVSEVRNDCWDKISMMKKTRTADNTHVEIYLRDGGKLSFDFSHDDPVDAGKVIIDEINKLGEK